MKRTALDLEQLLSQDLFVPFVVTLRDKAETALAIVNPRKAIVANSMLVMVVADKRLYHIPFKNILHITMACEEIG